MTRLSSDIAMVSRSAPGGIDIHLDRAINGNLVRRGNAAVETGQDVMHQHQILPHLCVDCVTVQHSELERSGLSDFLCGKTASTNQSAYRVPQWLQVAGRLSRFRMHDSKPSSNFCWWITDGMEGKEFRLLF